MDKNIMDNDNIGTRPQTSSGDNRTDHSEVHQAHAHFPAEVSRNAAADEFPHIPPTHQCKHDRAKPRSESELKAIFKFSQTDNGSVDIPSVLKHMCGYLTGLELVRKQLLSRVSRRHVSMEIPSTDHSEHLDDFSSDGEFMRIGSTSNEYRERLEDVKAFKTGHACVKQTYFCNRIHEHFAVRCCHEEKTLAEIVKRLRHNPPSDTVHFCTSNQKTYSESLIQRWKVLTAVNKTLSKHMESLSSNYPCLAEYSNIEQHFGNDGYLETLNVTGEIPIPQEWTKKGKYHDSLETRRIIAQTEKSCKAMNEKIMMDIGKMNEVRKENFVRMYNRCTGLERIVNKLTDINNDISRLERIVNKLTDINNDISRNQVAEVDFTQEETWYNKFSYVYIDMYARNTEKKVTEDAAHEWESSKKDERPRMSKNIVDGCSALHQKYGELVGMLRAQRESREHGIKAHVSELEAMVVQLQSKMAQMQTEFYDKELRWHEKDLRTQQQNAKLTELLDRATPYVNRDYEEQLREHCQRQKQQIDKLQEALMETRKTMKDLKAEKEILLTRLSKLAGNKLVHGNPAITDLSDSNRPTKLSERYSELYDNEWTDALEELTDETSVVHGVEGVFIRTLRAILIEAFTFCCETEARYEETITQSLICLPSPDPESAEQEQKDIRKTLTQEQMTQFDDLKKTCVPTLITAVESKFLSSMEKRFTNLFKQLGGHIKSDQNLPRSGEGDSESANKQDEAASEGNHKRFDLGPSQTIPNQDTIQQANTAEESEYQVPFSSLEKTTKFARICVNLCWWMRIKKPPMHIDADMEEGSDINVDFYKNYTQRGKRVKYQVWPALFLHKGGPLLCKGIVQPFTED
ncbi:uncharacterized protein LOC132553108 [Ylistrum balloti]|uniref:uncharacterized protein LOC132553108 n=1 Tax=Ylistrum balloti TaxID=509963 RepID=UPI002905CD81|nr:uncharacterized protein LOC132553108 [Ylistrum balloti]